MIKKIPLKKRAVEASLYYVRLKTHNGNGLFASEDDLPASLSKIVADELLLAANHRGITLDQWVIVPDAVHALVFLREDRPDPEASTGKPRLLTSFIAGFKAATAKRINLIRNQPGSSVWQRSYNEQRVEDEYMLMRLRQRITGAESIVMSSQ